jgi:hypothetical protein
MKQPKYLIIAYDEFGNDKDKHIFQAENGRQVVGLMKTIMDNFHPAHVDIMNQEKFNN